MSQLFIALILAFMLVFNVVIAEEESAVPIDTPDKNVELMQQAADGEVAMPRVAQPHKKLVKPDRMLMKASVNNTKAGYAFLDENQRLPGVIKLKSGLQYKVLKAGTGNKPNENDIVNCLYRGALIDGTVFEQSKVGKPADVKIAPLVQGLKEAILLMPVGSKWEIYLPSELGFGSAGKPPKVGPEAVLVYNLELIAISGHSTVPITGKP